MARRLIEIIEEFSERLGIRLFSHEYQIATVLIDTDKLTPKEIFAYSHLSSTGFFNTMERLTKNGIIFSQENEKDRRSKVYSLKSDVKKSIISHYKYYESSSIDAFESLRVENSDVVGTNSYKIHKLAANHLTCEHQILVYLYLRPGIPNSEFVDIVGSSLTKFNATLRQLVKDDHIYFERDPSDRRRKRYHITDEVRNLLDDLHEQTFEWLRMKTQGDAS